MSTRSPQSSVVEYRFTHIWDDEIVPVERYFTSNEPKEALDMFAYTCSKTGRKPILQEVAKWDRWGQSWIALPIPEREEYILSEDALIAPSEEEGNSSVEETDNPQKALTES